jgi:hypothetical protein
MLIFLDDLKVIIANALFLPQKLRKNRGRRNPARPSSSYLPTPEIKETLSPFQGAD